MLSSLVTHNILKSVSKFGFTLTTNLFHTNQIHRKSKSDKGCPKKQMAVVLVGCGFYDGTDISEAISVAIHVNSHNLTPKFFAPNVSICGHMNHYTKQSEKPSPERNALEESARIARSEIQPLCQCDPCHFEGLIVPGGLGTATTLSDFFLKGCECIIHPELESLIIEFKCQSKPIGSVSLAAAIMAKVLCGATVTLGKECPRKQFPYGEDVIDNVSNMDAKIEMHDVKGVTYCKDYNLYSTPGFLDAKATFADVHESIGKMVSMMSKGGGGGGDKSKPKKKKK